ncbi:integrin alpha FG-GAP repeat-containing protein 2 [Bulinus truncatus]|nr:integrin alpha FG-GAP repeat-containing protein 2 [Bulinus truncatus]
MVSQPGASFVILTLKPTFRHIKSDSYLDKMSDTKNENPLERNGSFAFTGKPDLLGSTLKSEVTSSKSDTVSNYSDTAFSRLTDSAQYVNGNESVSQKQSSKKQQSEQGNKSPNSPEKKEEKPGRKMSLDKLASSPSARASCSSHCSEHGLDEKLNHIFDAKEFCDEEILKPSLIYHPLAHMQARNKDTSTVIVGGINREKNSLSSSDPEIHNTATYYALATLDGSLILVENDCILWSLQVDHYLFALAKLDVTGNGQEEVVCCSWSGQTYIVNHSKEIVRYHFPDSVAAFCAGNYSLRGEDSNSPCFVYATFNNRIYIYPNIALPRVESTNLLEVMNRRPETHELLRKLNINADDHERVRKLYRWCLYGQLKKS